MIGNFGWLAFRGPYLMIVVWTATIGLVVALGLAVSSRRASIALLLVAGATALLPLVSEYREVPIIGPFWQGRYTLPLAVGVPIVASYLIGASSIGARLARSRLALVVGIALGVGQFLGFAQTVGGAVGSAVRRAARHPRLRRGARGVAGLDARPDAGGPRAGVVALPLVSSAPVSEIFDPEAWEVVPGFEDLADITYHRAKAHGTVRIAFDRPEVRNAFRPATVDELYRALDHARQTSDVGCVLLTGNGPSPRDGGWAFCSGGDQRIRGKDGYRYAEGDTAATIDPARSGRLHILEVQRLIRFMPKVVIAVVPGWAAGGGHSLHVVADLTLASREHARFKQTDADVASFDGGFGSAYLARQVGQKFAREIFFLGDEYSAEDAHRMGMVNAVVDHADLERVALEWAAKINGKSPTAQRMLKFSFNLIDDGLVGQQVFAGEATRLAYMTDEAAEGRDSFLEKRDPDWSAFPWHY
jgi:naphthoate synthase